jgi:hypothetical protein
LRLRRPADAAAGVDYTLSCDVSNDIRAVAALRDDGLITEEEYQQKKRELLGPLTVVACALVPIVG